MPDFEVRRDDLRATRVIDGEDVREAAGDGELQLKVDRFGLTANNVTYGVFGDAMRYWQFFPASEEGWGRVPVWGYGDVVVSGVDGIEPGERFYGYFPMSTYTTMRAERSGGGFTCGDEHRAELPGVYNQYLRTPADAEHADEQLLLRPLFATSFLIEDHLRANGYFGADAVVLGSASSKTAYGLAFLLARSPDGPHVLGLTSSGNVAFAERLDLYDRVIAYDAIAGDLPEEALVYVDMSGDTAVREAVHRAAQDRLKRDIAVGMTHWEQPEDRPSDLPGPAPELFFAPTHVERLSSELGPGELQRRLAAAAADFIAQLDDWIEIDLQEGAEALEAAWLELVDGRMDPARGQLIRLP